MCVCVFFILRRIINKHTDESLGDCSFLNTCFHMDTCKYVHYEIDSPPEIETGALCPVTGGVEKGLHSGDGDSNAGTLFPSQVRPTRCGRRGHTGYIIIQIVVVVVFVFVIGYDG